jgi:Cdc6-like AAA superfamily ATPase
VPHLPRGVEPRPLAEILQQRLDVKGIKTPLEELVDREALVALETICGERAYDLRQVLNLASSAAVLARQASSPTVSAAHVYAAQDATPER